MKDERKERIDFLGDHKAKSINKNTKQENSFIQWTLPSTEAVRNLCGSLRKKTQTPKRNVQHAYLPSTRQATETIARGCPAPSHMGPSETLGVLRIPGLKRKHTAEEDEHISKWCAKHNLDPVYVSENMDFFVHLFGAHDYR